MNNVMENQTSDADPIPQTPRDALLQATKEIYSIITIQNTLEKKIEESGLDAKTYLERNKKSAEIEAINEFNGMIDMCKIRCTGISCSQYTDIIEIESWADFIRLWIAHNVAEIYQYNEINKERKTVALVLAFFINNRCYTFYENIRPLTKEEIQKLGL